MSIIHAFLEWASAVLAPRAGERHRACPEGSASCASAVVPTPASGPRPRRRPVLPALRSPYGLDTPLKGEDVALVRPYLVAFEERQRQLQRRRDLGMAAHFGIDLDTRVIHGVGVS